MSTIHCARLNRLQAIDIDADVPIIGCGLVGATLAYLLGKRGVRTIVLEREASLHHLPRAVHFGDDVMRSSRRSG